MNAQTKIDPDNLQDHIAAVRVMDEFETTVMRDALDKTILDARADKARADKARADAEIDRIEDQIALLKQEKNTAVCRWNDAHVTEVRAQRKLSALVEQERR